MKLPVNICAACRAENDARQCIGKIEANSGELGGQVSVCMYCSHIAIFNRDNTLREPTVAELEILRHDKSLMKALRILHDIR